MLSKIIKKAEFQLTNYVKNGVSKKTSFPFKDVTITNLPFIEDGSIDLYDTKIQETGFSLVLRLTKKSKTFYIKTKKGKSVRISSMRSLGPHRNRVNGTRPPTPFITYADAVRAFQQKAEELGLLSEEALEASDMTIKQYIQTRYKHDRQNTRTKKGEIKEVSEQTIHRLICDFSPWVDYKIRDARPEWPSEFKKYWQEAKHEVRKNGTIQTQIGTTEETMRKKYVALNAVFNVCTARGYIATNPIDGFTHLFKRSKARSKTHYNYDFEEIVKFILEGDFKGGPAGRIIIATMILTAARNAEIYKNYIENFNSDSGEIFIPASISKNEAERSVYICPDTYNFFWDYVRRYLKFFHTKNSNGHMFPSPTVRGSHVTDTVYRPVWAAVKKHFDLKGRLYDVRHTFAKRHNDVHGIVRTAQIIGDSVATASEYYAQYDNEQKKETMTSIQSTKSSHTIESINETSINTVNINHEMLPAQIQELLEKFKNGKPAPKNQNQMYQDQWTKFVNFIENKHLRTDLGPEVSEWLEMQ